VTYRRINIGKVLVAMECVCKQDNAST